MLMPPSSRSRVRGRSGGGSGITQTLFRFSGRNVVRRLIVCLGLLAILPPIFFHLRMRRFHRMQLARCGWLRHPPLVCAHGGDSSNASPNTVRYAMLCYASSLFPSSFFLNSSILWSHFVLCCWCDAMRCDACFAFLTDGCVSLSSSFSSWLHWDRRLSFFRWSFVCSPRQVLLPFPSLFLQIIIS